MISFIIIGRNEGWRLTKCLTSIHLVINEDKITDYEIIFVDSKSTDDSIERAKSFKVVQVYKITGECNAAIARNIGALEAKGDVLFFIDGDMEIQKGFLPLVMDVTLNHLTYPFVSGIYEDYIYTENWEFLEVRRRYNLSEGMSDIYEPVTGGLFIINKELWNLLGGMDTRLVRSQDLDFGLMLANKGVLLLTKSYLLAYHHTIDYFNIKRKSNHAKYALYSALLARKHYFDLNYQKLFIRTQYTVIGLVISLVFTILFSPLFLLFYIILVLIKTYKANLKSNLNFLDLFRILMSRDFVFIFAFLSYYPKYKKLKYTKL
ncbi:MAG: glycosyltransferase [Paludibacter sp.]